MENEERDKLFANLAVTNEDEDDVRNNEAAFMTMIARLVNKIISDDSTLGNLESFTYDKMILAYNFLRFQQIENQIKSLDEKLDAMQERLENNNEKLDRIMFWLEDADKHKIYANKCIIKQKL